METVTHPVRVLAALGVQDLLLTNAAGGINSNYRPGEFMLLTDHLNFMGDNPLRGSRTASSSPFIDLSKAYDGDLNKTIQRAARTTRVKLHRGIYLAVSGPSYETPAEIRAFRKLGADAVGMSTVPETIVARACGIRVAGISCITNPAAGLSGDKLSHDDVLKVGSQSTQTAVKLLSRFAEYYGDTVTG